MIPVTVASQACFLVTEEADWGTEPKLTPSLPTTDERAATGREERYALGATLRCALEYTAILELKAMSALRNALQSALAQPILMPCWPLAHAGADWDPSAHTASNLVVGWMEGWTSYIIADLTAGGSIAPGTWDHVAPLLWGFFDKAPDPEAISDEGLTVKFSFSEDGPAKYALIPAPAFPVVAAPALGAFGVPVFPWEIDWAAPVKSGTAAVSIAHEEIGPGRQRLDICFPQAPARPLEGGITLTTPADIGAFLSWWLAQKADAGLQWVSTWLCGNRLAADAAAGATTLVVEDAAALSTNTFLALTSGAGTVGEYVHITDIAGNTLTLAAALVGNYPAPTSRCSLAMLGRHADNSIELTFTSDWEARVKLQWVELTQEYSVGDGQTRGINIGVLPVVGWLFEFERNYGGQSVFDYATNFEQDLTANDETSTSRVWTSRIIDFTDMVRSLDLADHALTLTAEWWEGGPFDQFLPGALEAVVTLRLFKCTVDGAVGSNVQQVWEGTVKAGFDATKVTAQVAGPSEIFKLQLPGDMFGPSCNARLYDARCGLAQADWQFAAVVTAISGNTITIEIFPRTGGFPSGFGSIHWFALGFLKATVGGIARLWSIYDSTALISSLAILTLRKPYTGAVSDAILLWPGCDKLSTTCRAYNSSTNPTGKFNNYANFRGFPFIPALAPQFALPTAGTTTGKK